VRVSYELVLQQYGWEKGWPLIMRMAGNARLFADSSSAIPNEIATGNVLAGPCIDFYARARVAQSGGEALAYMNPQGGSAITPDPISMLRKPPHRAMAEKFIAFVLSPEGQRLWILPPGSPGGPAQYALYRLPVRSDVFADLPSQTQIENPYELAGQGVYCRMDDELQNARTVLVAELVGAALVDLHDDVRATWKALIDGGMKPAALAEWNSPPFSAEESLKIAAQVAAGGREAKNITRSWTRDFKQKFERVRQLAR
jgi:ABC-type glycerol-3-phosphate transport system substrate-binding protein